MPEKSPMIGFQAARVIKSSSSKYPVGKYVMGRNGWRTVSKDNDHPADGYPPFLLPDQLVSAVPLSYFVGILGMPGATAYFGLLECCKPKAGETLVVNAAAGAVGSVVGQFGKILGLKVIGYAGTDEKCNWLKSIGFDHAFNYKKVDLAQSLKEGAPNGVDCFYDNVGGNFAVTVYEHMNTFGRVCQCGAISAYNSEGPVTIRLPHGFIIGKQLIISGFMFPSYASRMDEFIKQVSTWIREGKVKVREYPYDGFESMPRALIEQLEGKNTGKVIVNNK